MHGKKMRIERYLRRTIIPHCVLFRRNSVDLGIILLVFSFKVYLFGGIDSHAVCVETIINYDVMQRQNFKGIHS